VSEYRIQVPTVASVRLVRVRDPVSHAAAPCTSKGGAFRVLARPQRVPPDWLPVSTIAFTAVKSHDSVDSISTNGRVTVRYNGHNGCKVLFDFPSFYSRFF
jgi:hypothetical protein